LLKANDLFVVLSGLIPRWLLEVSVTILTNVLIHLLKTQFTAQKEVVSLYDFIATVSLLKTETKKEMTNANVMRQAKIMYFSISTCMACFSQGTCSNMITP